MPTPALSLFSQKVQAIRRVAFTAQSLAGSQMGWNGQAEGTVEVRHTSTPSEQTVYLIEKGQFIPESRPSASASPVSPVPFRNTFKLVFRENDVAFYHERFGAQHPVWLFDLIFHDNNTLTSQHVHQCAQDQYRVTVILGDAEIKMQWLITGPQKNECLLYHYT